MFTCAIFISGGVPGDPSALLRGKMHLLDRDAYGEAIRIPTAHVWGEDDLEMPENGQPLSEIRDAELWSIFVHHGGHEVPDSKDKDALRGTVRYI